VIDNEGFLQLGDFSYCTPGSIKGTPSYSYATESHAPEVKDFLLNKRESMYDIFAADIFYLGAVLLELVYQAKPDNAATRPSS
jgi:hypothetical protein